MIWPVYVHDAAYAFNVIPAYEASQYIVKHVDELAHGCQEYGSPQELVGGLLGAAKTAVAVDISPS